MEKSLSDTIALTVTPAGDVEKVTMKGLVFPGRRTLFEGATTIEFDIAFKLLCASQTGCSDATMDMMVNSVYMSSQALLTSSISSSSSSFITKFKKAVAAEIVLWPAGRTEDALKAVLLSHDLSANPNNSNNGANIFEPLDEITMVSTVDEIIIVEVTSAPSVSPSGKEGMSKFAVFGLALVITLLAAALVLVVFNKLLPKSSSGGCAARGGGGGESTDVSVNTGGNDNVGTALDDSVL